MIRWATRWPVYALLFLAHLSTTGAHATALSSWSWSATGTGGEAITGTADFSVVPDATAGFYDLTIALTNTSATQPSVSSNVLTGLYFNLSTSPGALGMLSATATGGLVSNLGQTTADGGSIGANICAPGIGGTAVADTCGSTLPGGREAAYHSASAQQYAIGTTGQSGVFNGNATTGTGQLNYGIAPAVGLSLSSNTGITNEFPYVLGTATFTLRALTTDQITVSDVSGAYGTAPEFSEAATTVTPRDTPVPEPSVLAIMGIGLAGIMFARRAR